MFVKNLTNFEKTQRVFEKTQQISEKLKDFLKNSKKKLKTQGKNSSYRRFPPRVIPGKTPKKKPALNVISILLKIEII